MKSVFQMGLLPQNNLYWMGQGGVAPTAVAGQSLNIDSLVNQLQAADNRQGIINTFMTNNPNYASILGVDSDRFNTMLNEIQSIASDITNLEQILASHAIDSISVDDANKINDYINVTNALVAIVQGHTASGASPSSTVPNPSIVSATQQAMQAGMTPTTVPQSPLAPGAPKPAVAPKPGTTVAVAQPGPSPLLIGGGIAAALVVAALVVKG